MCVFITNQVWEGNIAIGGDTFFDNDLNDIIVPNWGDMNLTDGPFGR